MKYTWTTGTGFTPPSPIVHAVVQVRDLRGRVLFGDDHEPTPAPSTWRPGKTYTYRRTVFVPVFPYVGEAEVLMGLAPEGGPPAFKAATLELLPQSENIFLVYKEGWNLPEATPDNPAQYFGWTKRDAVVAFKNPRRDVVVYLEADTDVKAFPRPPVLTLRVGSKEVAAIPIDGAAPFLKKVKVGAATLGGADWVDLVLSMNGTFSRGDEEHRELGLRVLHLYVGEAARLAGDPRH